MINLTRGYWLSVVVMFVVLFNELFNCSAIVKGFTVDSGIKQYEAMLLAAIGYSMMASDLLKKRITIREYRVVVVLLVILLLYMLTPVFYDESQDLYTTYLLVFGSECIRAAYIGLSLAKSDDLLKLNKVMPFFLVPSVLIIGAIGLATALIGGVIRSDAEDSGGLNYQNISYYMAFAFSYFCYLLFFSNAGNKHRNRYVSLLYLFFIVFCVLVCLMSGGRGGFVLIVFDALFLFYLYNPGNSQGRIRVYVFMFFLSILLFSVLSHFDVLNSDGMQRVLSNLTEDSAREDLYQSAFDAFLSSPIIGNGVGSIWWTVGYYSHNIVLDLLAEVGIIGMLFFVLILAKTFFSLMNWQKSTPVLVLFLMIFVNNIVFCFFSGYWFGAMQLFFVCAFVYCLKQTNIEEHCSESSQ